jgi:hypothetical protein
MKNDTIEKRRINYKPVKTLEKPKIYSMEFPKARLTQLGRNKCWLGIGYGLGSYVVTTFRPAARIVLNLVRHVWGSARK